MYIKYFLVFVEIILLDFFIFKIYALSTPLILILSEKENVENIFYNNLHVLWKIYVLA